MWQRWEWRVGEDDPQVIEVELSLLSGQEIVRVDGETIVEETVWSFRSEHALDLNDGSRATVHVSVLPWPLPKCELRVGGSRLAPAAGPTYSGSLRLLAALVPLTLVILLPSARPAWIAAHGFIGGTEVPAPAWDEGDLLPLPPEDQNAWYLMGKYSEIPHCDFETILESPDEPIPADKVDLVAMGLSLLEVRELFERAARVFEFNDLANPKSVAPPFSSAGAHRISAWHAWVLLSWMRAAERAPSRVAHEVARTVPMWIGCANTSREELIYELCLRSLIADLAFARRLTTELGCADCAEGRAALQAALRDAPEINSDNLRIAMYLTAHAELSEFVDFDQSRLRKLTDVRASFASLETRFSESLEVPCEGLVEPLDFWDYNAGGRIKLRKVMTPRCNIAPRSQTYLNQIENQRRDLLASLAAM